MRSITIAILASIIAACSGQSDGTSQQLQAGTWRAVTQLPGGAMPFFVELDRSQTGWSATVVNGNERLAVPEVVVEGTRVALVFPAFNNRIDLELTAGGELVGELTLVKRYGELQVMPTVAARGSLHRFSQAPAPAGGDVSGRWDVRFTDGDGAETQAVAEFQQFGHEVLGTFLTPLGDYRYLAGELQAGRLSLSTFDGAHAFLFTAVLGPDGDLTGDFWSGTQWHETWVARRDEAAALPDADQLTHLRPGYERIEFEFPDEQGRMVSLDDPRFAGKVVVITLAGSWCPNCHDEAVFMAPLYREYRERGVEVVALMYEHFEDFETAAEQVQRFREEKGIGYTTLIAGVSDKTLAAETLPMLDAVLAFPTTIFLARDGSVQRIHTGFAGPGTGEHYRAQSEGFRATLEELLTDAG